MRDTEEMSNFAEGRLSTAMKQPGLALNLKYTNHPPGALEHHDRRDMPRFHGAAVHPQRIPSHGPLSANPSQAKPRAKNPRLRVMFCNSQKVLEG